MNERSFQKQTFLQGTAILALGTVLVKLIGFLFKTPLNSIIGSTGFGYFNTAYTVYNVLLMISTTGLPVAMSRMISEAQTLGNHAQIRRIFRTALYAFLTIGILGTAGMLLLSRQLSVMVTTNENSWAAIAALAPCVLFICLISAYRGFFQGQSNMTPTSVSQVLEALTRLLVGLGLAWLVMKKTGSIVLAAGGAILGVTCGCLVSAIYLHLRYRRASCLLTGAEGTEKSTRATMKELLAIAVPITIGSAGLQIINLFDTMIDMRRLTGALAWSTAAADSAKGVYDFCQTVFALPCAFIPTITVACIPAITAFLTKKDAAGARATGESAFRTMALIAMPCAAGLALLAEPILRLLCPGYSAQELALGTPMLSILGAAVIFNSLVLLLNAVMQAHGNVTTPVVNMFLGGLVKIAVNYVLVGLPEVNIIGAPVGTLACYVTITLLNLWALRREQIELSVFRNLVRPFLAAGIMGAATWMVYRVLSAYLPSFRIAFLLSLVFAVVVYAVLAVALRCITYEDCMLLPKGEKIAKLLRIKEKNE